MKCFHLMFLNLVTLCGLTYADGNGPVVINVKEDSDVVLPCSLSSKENLESGLFDWKKDEEEGGKRVFMYDAGAYSGRDFADQDKQFEGRVSHFPHELKNSNSSIKITETRVSDSGTYSCIFPRLQPRQTFSIQLLVGACPRPSVSILDQSKDWSLLQCEVYGASPKPVLEWRDSSGNILPSKEAQVTERGGSYDIILQTTVTKSDHYSCVVTQEEFCHQVKGTVSVVMCGGAVSFISAVQLTVGFHTGPPVGWMVFSGILSVLLLLVLVAWGYSLYREKTKCSEERISSMI